MGGAEQGYVEEAFATNWLSTVGPNLNALEETFARLTGLPAVAVSTGTAAIHLGLRLLGVGPGDEVICPSLTFVASVNPVAYLSARPVFVDSERETWNLDPALVEELLETRRRKGKPLPKALNVVHLFGQSARIAELLSIAGKYGVAVIEDAAEALGTLYDGRQVGTAAPVSAFSFNGNKIITGTGGGMAVCQRPEDAARLRKWATQARDPSVDYLHSELGYNYRMSNVIAGIVRGQLEVLDLRVRQRREVFQRYRSALCELPGVTPMPEPSWCRATRWLSCFTIDAEQFGLTARELIAFLQEANVEARPVWKPMHTQPLYAGHEMLGGAVAEELNERGICLPSSSSLLAEDQNFVIERIVEAHEQALAGAR